MHFKMSSAICFNMDQSKILSSGNGLMLSLSTCPKLCQVVKSEPFPKQQILDSSKLKEFADDNFKSDDNGRKFSKGVENTVGKGKIARYEQFLLFPQCFQKTFTEDM